ncbi:MAG: class A beta-lactamase [bacterium]|nr:class A beta-lactamase [bacterium]
MVLILFGVLMFQGCQHVVEPFQPAAPDPPELTDLAPSKPQPSPIKEKLDRDLEAELGKITEAVHGRVGIGARLIESGEAAYLDRHGRYPMLSVHKLPIAMAVLKKVDDGELRLYQDIGITPEDFVRPGYNSAIRYEFPEGVVLPLRDVIAAAISESDGTASDVLLKLAGGPEGVQAYLSSNGLGEAILVSVSEKTMSTEWENQYANWATPEATVRLLKAINDRRAGLSDQTTQVLLDVMNASKTGERRVMAGLPRGTPYAHKTGTGGREKGITSATNDVGLITLPDGRHVAIAVYIRDSKGPSSIRLKAMQDIAAAVWKKWAGDELEVGGHRRPVPSKS